MWATIPNCFENRLPAKITSDTCVTCFWRKDNFLCVLPESRRAFMALMKTSNPALNDNTFRGEGVAFGQTMTLNGTINKTGVLLICAIATAAWTWNLSTTAPDRALGLVIPGAIGGLIVAFVNIFKKSWAPITAPLYALLVGLVLGGISSLFVQKYPGIAIQAVGLTFGTLMVMLLAYRLGL